MNQQLKISNRLFECANMVSQGAAIADIGTDHAYIPIWLAQNSRISSALACDIRTGPLEIAKKNIEKHNLSNIIETRISDGLKSVLENEATEIIIAGMGGNIISKILSECTWENKSQKIFIIQPMKYEERLREYLAENGYSILHENAVICCKKIYTTMKVIFSGEKQKIKAYQKYIGKLESNHDSNAAQAYIRKQIKNLINHLNGARAENLQSRETYYYNVISDLKKLLIEEGN
ncbi:MAG: class I SAM-dependent methyltransferase [Acutalibacteraceae bacterium]